MRVAPSLCGGEREVDSVTQVHCLVRVWCTEVYTCYFISLFHSTTPPPPPSLSIKLVFPICPLPVLCFEVSVPSSLDLSLCSFRVNPLFPSLCQMLCCGRSQHQYSEQSFASVLLPLFLVSEPRRATRTFPSVFRTTDRGMPLCIMKDAHVSVCGVLISNISISDSIVDLCVDTPASHERLLANVAFSREDTGTTPVLHF